MKKPILNEKLGLNLFRAVLAECFATGLFVFLGTGTIVATGLELSQDGLTTIANGTLSRILPISTGFGIAYGILLYMFLRVSGGHMNPAVTLTMFLLGECSFIRLTLYWIAQLFGALLGSLVLWGCVNDLRDAREALSFERAGVPPLALGAVELNDAINQGNGFFFEFMGTMILCWAFAVFNHSHGKLATPALGPLATGLTVLVLHLVLLPFTGCGINPARMFGPALANSFAGDNTWNESAWIYWIGPLVGSLLAALIYLAFHDSMKSDMPADSMPKQVHEPVPEPKTGGESGANPSSEKPHDQGMTKAA